MCPIFASSASNCLPRYKQILSGCSLGCKNALNFTCLSIKFHNCVHTTVPVWFLDDDGIGNMPLLIDFRTLLGVDGVTGEKTKKSVTKYKNDHHVSIGI